MQSAYRSARVLVVLAALGLAACARLDDGDGLTDLQREDMLASANIAGLFSFANAQIAGSTNETAEPRNIDGITPPQDDTAEPFTL